MTRTLLIILAMAVAAAFRPADLPASDQPLTYHCVLVPPFAMQNENGAIDGIVVEMAERLIRSAGMTPVFESLPWNRAMEYIKSGRLDMMTILSKTPEREKFIHFLGQCIDEQVALLVRRENKGLRFETLDDLARDDHLFGIRQNFFYSVAFNRRLETDPSFREHFEANAKGVLNLEKVKQKRLTGTLGNYIGLAYMQKTNPAYSGLVVMKLPFFEPSPTYFGVSKAVAADADKLARLEKAHAELTSNGVFGAIVDKWLN